MNANVSIKVLFSFLYLCRTLSVYAASEELQQLYQQPLKPDNYLYQLLALDSARLAGLSDAQLETELNNAFTERVGVARGIPDESLRVEVIEELGEARALLGDRDTRRLYTSVGHNIYNDLVARDPNLSNYIKQQNIRNARARTIQYYSALLNDEIENPLQYMATTPLEPINEATYDRLNPSQQHIYRALGPTAFNELSSSDLRALERFVTSDPPKNDMQIFKQRVDQLLCKIRTGRSCEKDTTPREGEKKTPADDSKPEEGKKRDTKEKDSSIDAFKKANQKLQSALHSLNTAKRYLKTIDKDQRSNVRTRIKNELDDYKAIQAIARKIKQKGESAHAEKRKFAQLVEKLYAAARGI